MTPEQNKIVQDTKILQKVNAAHRVAFAEKYPGQVEHCLRLLSERLQAGLDKRDGVDVNDVTTWKMTPSELADLTEAIYYLHQIRESFSDVRS